MEAGRSFNQKGAKMNEQMKRITRKVCEELGIQHGLKDPKAVMQNRKLRKLAHEMIERALTEENEPRTVETPPPGENGGPPVIEMELEPEEEEKSGS